MTNYNHDAIRKAYPNAITIEDGFGVKDADGNQIQLDQALVDAAAIEVAAEQALKALRTRRNQLLAETDWVTLKAIDDSNDGLGIQLPQVWMDYRQALRDLPANTSDPANVVWPTKPEVN
jgi:hypothetical protein